MQVSTRSHVDPFIVMDMMEAARRAEAAGRHIIHMEVGQPSTGAPQVARAALRAAIADAPLGYTVALGLPELRAGIARLYKKRHGIDLDPARVVVTAGSSAAFLLAFTALFDPGARVGLGLPGYPSYRHILRALSLEPIGIETHAAHRFQPVIDDLPTGLSGLIVASPANPTGTMLGRSELQTLIETCASRQVSFVSDEIYHGIEYTKPAISALEISDDVYVINSFSKYFSMTGWRVGWMIVPPDHIRTIERLAQNMFICPPHASQRLALGALEAEAELQANLAVYARNRDLMLSGLPQAGFTEIAPPDGAFYIYADLRNTRRNARALAAEILDKCGVALTPGTDFDPIHGDHFLRFSYAGSTDDIREGIRRLRDHFGG